MAIIDVVKYQTVDGELCHKFDSDDLRMGTQQVVHTPQAYNRHHTMFLISKFINPMKHIIFFLITACAMAFASCGSDGGSTELQAKVDSLSTLVSTQQATIAAMRDSIVVLQFPADQRLDKIKQLIAAESFADAKNEIASLQSYFPHSQEAAECSSLTESINSKLAAIEAEKERVRALGFKALKPQSKVSIDYNTLAFSGISTGNKFIHDVYPTYTGSEWREHTADRGNKYITVAMDVTSTSKNPNIPTLAFYSIHGSSLSLEDSFRVDMARWSDYGTYLGNEPDLKNDFSKVSTVKFKLGCELPEDVFSKPYIVVLKKANTQARNEERMRNPPIYYYGEAGYPQTLTIDDFNNGNYVAIKIANI